MANKQNSSNPSVTTDSVVFLWREGELSVLGVKRKGDPFEGAWALPGGFVGPDEDLDKAAKRELKEETSLKGVNLEQFHTFGDPKRDPRGRVISVVFIGLVDDSKAKIQAGDDAEDAQWLNVSKLPKLAFDHKKIIKAATQRLQERVIHQLDGASGLNDTFSNGDMRELLLLLYSLENK